MIVVLIILAIIVVLAVVYLILSAPNQNNRRAGMEKLFVNYAHRGLWNDTIPENSIPAFSKAVEEGFAVELDVQLSSDGDVVVFHDYNLQRMCGEDTLLSSKRGAELSWRKLKGTEYTLPLLSDVLAVIKGRVPVLIELKGESSDTSLCPELARVLEYYDGKYCVESFNPFLLGWFKKNRPRVARGLLYTDFMKNGTKNLRNNILLSSMITNVIARPDFIAVDQNCSEKLPVKLMRKLHKLPTLVWTVHDERTLSKFRKDDCKVIFDGFIPEKIGSQN